jgi:hypothetical protein
MEGAIHEIAKKAKVETTGANMREVLASVIRFEPMRMPTLRGNS